jgi:hypothetical protein
MNEYQIEIVDEVVEIVEVTEQGPPGQPGLNPRDAYDPNEQYQPRDWVTFQGSSWHTMQTVQGVAPPGAPWQLLTGKGDPGDVGGSLPWSQITEKPTPQTDIFPITTDGAQTIALSHTPLEPAQLGFHINGVRQHDRTDFTLDGFSLTLGASWNLFSGDVLEFSYTY